MREGKRRKRKNDGLFNKNIGKGADKTRGGKAG